MVDVHILCLEHDRKDWFQECVDSLKNEPVQIYYCDGIEGDIGRARTEAFKVGKNPFVAFVDPDDAVVPGIFARLVEALKNDLTAVMAYSDEMLIDESGRPMREGISTNPRPFFEAGLDLAPFKVNGHFIHHLRVMRRDAVEKCLPLKTKMYPECALMRELNKLGKFIHLREIGYRWRIHSQNSFWKFTDEDRRELSELK